MLIVAQFVKKYSSLYGGRKFIGVSRPPHDYPEAGEFCYYPEAGEFCYYLYILLISDFIFTFM